MNKKIGFIGLGLMGKWMSINLVKAGPDAGRNGRTGGLAVSESARHPGGRNSHLRRKWCASGRPAGLDPG